MRALIFEADATVRAWIDAALRGRGHSVSALAGAEAAWADYEQTRPSLVVLDWAGLDGPRLCRSMRASSDGDRCAILAMGLSDRPADLQAALEAGADDYLPKPSDAATLAARLAVVERRVGQIEDRARAVEALRRLEKAVETMRLGVTITDAQGTILYLNPAEAAMHGYGVEELQGHDARILSPREYWKKMTPDELGKVKQWRRQRLRRRKDGSTFPVQLLSDAVTDSEGRAVGIVTTCEDISERKRSEKALRESEHRYRSLVEAARDMISTVSPDGTISSLNPAFERLTGWPISEWKGRSFEALIHPDDLSTARSLFLRVLRGEAPQAAELRLLTRAGELRVVECAATPEVRDGEIVGILSAARDITDRKRAQQRQATLHVATRVLGEAATLAEGAQGLLHGLCVGLGWEVGLLWTEEKDGLRCVSLWHLPTVDVAPLQAAVHGTVFTGGQGEPESVCASGLPHWVPDAAQDPRFLLPGALEAGLHSTLAFPIVADSQVIGVLQLLSPEVREPDASLLRMTEEIGGQIGQLIRRRQAEEALRDSEERYALAVRGTNDGLWDWNLRTGEVYFSPRWKAMLGYEEDEVGSRLEDWFERVHPEDSERVKSKAGAHLEGKTPHFEDEHRLRHKDGGYRWVLCRGFAARDAAGRAYRMTGAQTDITDRRTYDPLTSLPNRALFVERLGQALSCARRRPETLFAVLFIDLDRFKVVNDSLGHLAGDQLLLTVSRRLETCLRPGDVVGRFGGDEFAVLLDPIKDVSDATRVADRIQRELRLPMDTGGHEVFTSASIGIALSATGYQRADDILRDADTAMYRAKASGKARYEVFDEAMRERVLAQLRMENDLRRALDRGELRLYYQPIVSLASSRVTGFEALLRWEHPQRGLVMPSEFVPVAEETGLIVPMGYWVLREACVRARAWQSRFPLDPHLCVSVNVSGRQFADPAFVPTLETILAETGFDPRSLRLEITEGVILEGTKAVASVLRKVRALGIHLDIDDFGTGYSSLGYLHRFPADALKVDRSFVKQMNGGDTSAIVRTILALAHNLGMTVIAEGVETSRQAAHLKALHCEQGQGYYFSKPLDAAAAETLLAEAASRRLAVSRKPRARVATAPPALGRA